MCCMHSKEDSRKHIMCVLKHIKLIKIKCFLYSEEINISSVLDYPFCYLKFWYHFEELYHLMLAYTSISVKSAIIISQTIDYLNVSYLH